VSGIHYEQDRSFQLLQWWGIFSKAEILESSDMAQYASVCWQVFLKSIFTNQETPLFGIPVLLHVLLLCCNVYVNEIKHLNSSLYKSRVWHHWDDHKPKACETDVYPCQTRVSSRKDRILALYIFFSVWTKMTNIISYGNTICNQAWQSPIYEIGNLERAE
jgi:hypothetical protein